MQIKELDYDNIYEHVIVILQFARKEDLNLDETKELLRSFVLDRHGVKV